MSQPKRIDADSLIRRYYEGEGEDTGQEGAFPEDTMDLFRCRSTLLR